MTRRLKALLVAVHLYSGIALCLLFVAWFVSGIGMAYYRTPVLTEAQRLGFSEPLGDVADSLAPGQVPSLVSDWKDAAVLRLGQVQGRPLYRWRTPMDGWRSAWADTGLPASFEERSLRPEVERWFGRDQPFHYDGPFDQHSQWSYFVAARDHYPLHRFSTAGSVPRQVFFSARTGEPVVATSFGSRLLYYLGPGLHYFSLYPIRNNDPLWRALVNWTSGIGALTCLIGIVLGVWQLRWTAIGTRHSIVPYARRWMRWHHWTGLVFGFLTFTFVLSGLFSMNPAGMFPTSEVPPRVRAAFQGPLPSIETLAAPSTLLEALVTLQTPKELEWKRVRGQPYAMAVQDLSAQRLLWWADTERVSERSSFTDDELLAFVTNPVRAPIERIEHLREFDNYYYARKEQHLPLPVLRVRLLDAASTWYYVDPVSGQLFLKSNNGTRVRRWLYNGLHSFDPQFLLRRGHLWDVVIWVVSLCGLSLSLTGCVIAWHWIQRRAVPRRTPGALTDPARLRFEHTDRAPSAAGPNLLLD